MGNCTGKPKVTETAMPPAPLKEEETSTVAVSDVKTDGDAKTEEIVEEKKEEGEAVTSENRSLGVLLKEAPEVKDDKTEVEAVVAEPVIEEIKAEVATEESSAEKVAEPVKAVEEVKVEEAKEVAPVVEKKEEAPVEVVATPVVEAVKAEDKAVATPVQAPVAEVAAPVVEVAAPVEVAPVPVPVPVPASAPVVEAEKVAPTPVTEVKTEKAAELLPVSTPEKVTEEAPKEK